nr:hypothetical protein [Tanacetum cinerariifolium]
MMDMIVNNNFRLSMNRNQVTIRTMMCQPTDNNIDFSGSDQIQTPQYPDVHENPLTNDEFEAFMKANDDKINDLEIKFDQFQKQCEQMQDDLLNQMRNFIQNFQSGPPGEDKKHEATTDSELLSTEDIHPLAIQEPPRESDIFTSNSVSTPQVSKGVNNANVIAPGMFRISPDKISREAKKVPNTD